MDAVTRYEHVPGYYCPDCDMVASNADSRCRNCGEEMQPSMVLTEVRDARKHGEVS